MNNTNLYLIVLIINILELQKLFKPFNILTIELFYYYYIGFF